MIAGSTSKMKSIAVLLEHASSDDQVLNLTRAFIYFCDTRVSVVTLGGHLRDIAFVHIHRSDGVGGEGEEGR